MFFSATLSLVVLMVVGLPVGFSLLSAGIFGNVMLLGSRGGEMVPKLMFDSMNSFILAAVPMFIIMGRTIATGGIGVRMYDFASVWLRHLPGGLAIATIVCCAVLAAIAGSSTAIIAAVGTAAIPELLRRGYPPRMALGMVTAGATLGILIPPSVPLLIFSAITDESAGKLFLAGVFPGIVLTALMAAYASFAAVRAGVTRLPQAPWAERLTVTKRASWGLLLPIVVLGSIYTGVATATESAALGTLLSLFIAVVIYKELKLREVPILLMHAAATSGMIMLIVQGAVVLGKFATMVQVPQELVLWVSEKNLTALELVLAANLLFLVLGCFLEVVSIMMITLPVLVAPLIGLQVDLVWFAIIMMINMEIALITPPVGLNLYVVGGLLKSINLKVPQSDVIRGVIPYFFLMLSFMILCIFWPPLITGFPKFFN